MKKILFIIPPCISLNDLTINDNTAFSNKIRKEIPLGALTLASYFNYYNMAESYILDINLMVWHVINGNDSTLKNYLLKEPYSYIRGIFDESKEKYDGVDYIAISAIFSSTYCWLDYIGLAAKNVFDGCRVIAGGGLPTNMPELILQECRNIDIISYGEGEIGIARLLNSVDEDEAIEKSHSLTSREKIKKYGIGSLKHEFIEILDNIPPLDFSLIEFNSYNNHAHAQKSRNVKALPLMFSRGCPFRCCFCASHSVHGRNVRYNSITRIKSDIELFIKQYDINTITVWDDNFFVDKTQAIDLLMFFKELDLTVEFVNGFPVYRMDDDMANMLKESGVETVTLAIESGSDRVLKEIIHKPLKTSMVSEAISTLKKHNFYIKGLFVIGFPGETKAEIEETMKFIHESNLNWVDIFIASPLPGSELYDICVKEEYLKGDALDLSFFGKGSIETEDFKAEDIEHYQLYNVIKKDYVNNLDMRNNNWQRALLNFEYVINANHENPFAYYYAYKASSNLNLNEKKAIYLNKALEIFKNNKSYRNLLEEFQKEGIVFSEI